MALGRLDADAVITEPAESAFAGSAVADSVITVTMVHGNVVITPTRPLDDAGLDALRGLVEGARAAGATPVVEVGALSSPARAAVIAALADIGETTSGPVSRVSERRRSVLSPVAG